MLLLFVSSTASVFINVISFASTTAPILHGELDGGGEPATELLVDDVANRKISLSFNSSLQKNSCV